MIIGKQQITKPSPPPPQPDASQNFRKALITGMLRGAYIRCRCPGGTSVKEPFFLVLSFGAFPAVAVVPRGEYRKILVGAPKG